jgi:Xaa-Pro dipeptidase
MSSSVDRLAIVRRHMDQADLDVLVCRLPENIVAFSGYFCVLGYAALVIPREADPILIASRREQDWVEDGWVKDVRYFAMWDTSGADPDDEPQESHLGSTVLINRRLRQIADERAFPTGRVGYEGSFEFIAPPVIAPEPVVPAEPSRRALAEVFPQSELVDATEQLNGARAIKTAHDREMLLRANEVNALGLCAWKEACGALATEAEAAAAFQAAVTAQGIGYKGARFAMGWPQTWAGPETGNWAYKPTSSRRIAEGDFVVCETAVCVDGYYVDLTRTIVVGEPAPRQRELFEVTNHALDAAIGAIRPGVRAADVHRIANEAFGDYLRYTMHHTGHGVGWKYHEPIPSLTAVSEDVLEEGMCIAVEPGAYIHDYGGVRNEHNVMVTADGAEILSDQFPVSIT